MERAQEPAADAPSLVAWAALGVVAIIILTVSVLLLPRLIYPPLSNEDLRGVATQRERLELREARSTLQNDARTTILQGLGGAFFLITAFFTWQQVQNSRHELEVSRRQLEHAQKVSEQELAMNQQELRQSLEAGQEERRLSREEQITSRFSQAVEHLASPNQHVRVGAVFSFERIALASSDDLKPVVEPIFEVLTTYVREQAQWKSSSDEVEGNREFDETNPNEFQLSLRPIYDPLEEDSALTMSVQSLRVRAPDIQAALTVLGRLPNEVDVSQSLHLGRVNLRKVDLRKAHLEAANLVNARLEIAFLHGANLRAAILYRAQLQGAYLREADLTNADLIWANCFGAHFERACLQGADLKWASLSLAYLDGADLRGADLRHATVAPQSANNLLLEGAKYDGGTEWPAGFDPSHVGAVRAPDAREEWQERQRRVTRLPTSVDDPGGAE
jgi:uncharacterized protein YjbI with pentapeptide repeats